MKAKFPNIAISIEAQTAIPHLMPTMALQESVVCAYPSADTRAPRAQRGDVPACVGDTPCPCVIPSLDGDSVTIH